MKKLFFLNINTVMILIAHLIYIATFLQTNTRCTLVGMLLSKKKHPVIVNITNGSCRENRKSVALYS